MPAAGVTYIVYPIISKKRKNRKKIASAKIKLPELVVCSLVGFHIYMREDALFPMGNRV